jgi:photosystem II stability/assembly factor-like uncharacterized protein
MELFTMFSRGLVLLSLIFAMTGPGPVLPAAPPVKPFSSFIPFMTTQMTYSELGPTGGEVTAFIINPLDSQEMYAGTFGGGVFKSTDGGATWQKSNSGLIDLYIQSMAIDPKNPSTVYAGMYKYGVYKSTDSGLNWSPTGPGLNQDAVVYDLQVDPQNPNILYAGTRSWTLVFTYQPPWGGGVFKSIDGGNSWTVQNNGLTEDWVYSLVVDPTNPATIYAASHSQGVFKSVDSAATWKAMNNGLSDLAGRSIVVDSLHPQTVYFGAWHTGGVYKTSNGGTSWSQISNGLGGAKIYKLFIDPVDPTNVYAATYLTGLYKTTNSGSGWNLAGYGADFITSIGVDPNNHDRVFAGTAGAGLFSSSDGAATWKSSSSGLTASLVNYVAANADYLFVGLDGGGMFRSRDSGVTWLATSEFEHFPVNTIVVNPSNSKVVYAATSRQGVLKTTDGGNTWSTVNNGLAAATNAATSRLVPGPLAPQDILQALQEEERPSLGNEAGVFLSATISYSILTLAFDWRNPANVYLGTNTGGVIKSSNSGSSWASSGLSGMAVYTLAVDPVNSQTVYAGTDGSAGALWKSMNGGQTWNGSNSGIQNLTVSAVVIDQANANDLYAATSDGVYYSSDGGSGWQLIGFSGATVYSLALTPQGLFAGTDRGLRLTHDGGDHWLEYSSGTPAMQVNSMMQTSANGKILFAATNGQGLVVFPGNPN